MKHEKHKRALLIWLAIYPLITILFYLLGDFIQDLPIPAKTLILTLIAVPLVVYLILPFYMKIFRRWL
jgi:antibiotic biosynthesis monooxygenase (ABM) superfamily enzyme